MSLISDVKKDFKELDVSKSGLKRFGLIFALFIAGISTYNLYLQFFTAGKLLLAFGFLLATISLLNPRLLRHVYFPWMAAALSIGWIVSRTLIIAVFYLVIAPIGLAARIAGKDFLGLNEKPTYWVRRDQQKKPKYDKMY